MSNAQTWTVLSVLSAVLVAFAGYVVVEVRRSLDRIESKVDAQAQKVHDLELALVQKLGEVQVQMAGFVAGFGARLEAVERVLGRQMATLTAPEAAPETATVTAPETAQAETARSLPRERPPGR